MNIKIELATTLQELDDVFKLRHRVLVEEEGYLPPTSSGRVLDRFDATPDVATFTAHVDGELAGSIRFMKYTSAGASPDDYFDFKPYLSPTDCLGGASHLVVLQRYRLVPRLVTSLFAMGYTWCLEQGLTHLTGASNPVVASGFVRTGWKRIGPTFLSTERGLWVQPIMLDLVDLTPRLQNFIAEHHQKHGRGHLHHHWTAEESNHTRSIERVPQTAHA